MHDHQTVSFWKRSQRPRRLGAWALLCALNITILIQQHQAITQLHTEQRHRQNEHMRLIQSLDDWRLPLERLSKQMPQILAQDQALMKTLKNWDQPLKTIHSHQKETTQILSELKSLRQRINTLTRAQHPQKEIPTIQKQTSPTLPFQVISVDVLSGEPFVSIQQDHRVNPFTLHQTIAGWTVTALDFPQGLVQWQDMQGHQLTTTVMR